MTHIETVPRRTGNAILGDWGTSNLRLWRRRPGHIVDRVDGPGIGMVDGRPEEVLSELTVGWRNEDPTVPIVLCGMAGARNGLQEAGYVECPASAAEWATQALRASFCGHPLRIGAGLACWNEGLHDDVMRGEETQVFGAIKIEPSLAMGKADLILPGTHSKWVSLEDGRIAGLRTFLTGELYALLQESSLFAAGGVSDPNDEALGFSDGVKAGKHAPGPLSGLFRARSEQLRQGRSASWARGYVSGLLLAGEVAEMARRDALPESVLLIGSEPLCARYTPVLSAFDVTSRRLDGEACTLAGLELILELD